MCLSGKWKKVKPWSQDRLIATGAYPGFCSMKRLEVFLLPLHGMLVHCRSLPHNLSCFPNNLPVPIYTPGWREALWKLSVLPKNTTQCPRSRLKPGPLTPESSALTMRPPHWHFLKGNGLKKLETWSLLFTVADCMKTFQDGRPIVIISLNWHESKNWRHFPRWHLSWSYPYNTDHGFYNSCTTVHPLV